MDILKRFVFYFVGAAVALAAVGFYFLVVRVGTVKYQESLGMLKARAEEMKPYADGRKPVPTEASIKAAAGRAASTTAEMEACDEFLANQPRRAHTSYFLENPWVGQPAEIKLQGQWRTAYGEYNEALREQIKAAGLSYSVQTNDGLWGSQYPTREQMRASMPLYWLQKDMIDLLTGQVEKDFVRLLQEKGEGFPTKPSDLVVNRKVGTLNEFLRTLATEELYELFTAIIFNPRNEDLPSIFNRIVPQKLPWERPAGAEGDSVLGFTMDEEQRKFMTWMVPSDSEDLFNRRRFIEHVKDLREVRYRADVIALLERRGGYGEIVEGLRRGREEESLRIQNDIKDWNRTRFAQAIDAIVSVREEDCEMLQRNHAPAYLSISNLEITYGVAAVGEEAPPQEMASDTGAERAGLTPAKPDVYIRHPFQMTVRIEFERLPAFLRRLMGNSWQYRTVVTRVVPVQITPADLVAPGEVPAPAIAPPPIGALPQPAPAGVPDRPPVVVEGRNFVEAEIHGVALQFSPLREMVTKRNADRPQPAAAPAVENGAGDNTNP